MEIALSLPRDGISNLAHDPVYRVQMRPNLEWLNGARDRVFPIDVLKRKELLKGRRRGYTALARECVIRCQPRGVVEEEGGCRVIPHGCSTVGGRSEWCNAELVSSPAPHVQCKHRRPIQSRRSESWRARQQSSSLLQQLVKRRDASQLASQRRSTAPRLSVYFDLARRLRVEG